MAKRKRPHTPVAPHVVCWLERRKKAIPAALRAADGPAAACLADLPRVLALLPDLRERERRALARHVDKCMREDSGGNDDGDSAPAGSDGEYERGDDPAGAVRPPPGWPARVEFSNEYRWAVPADVRGKYRPADGAARRRAARPSRRVCVRRIEDPDHPAYPERGMYCALPHAPPGTWLLDYVGHVTSGEDQDARSDYVSDFGERGELSCDAASYGNEARFLNDFRNTGRHPNVEFRLRRDGRGELRQGVYVRGRREGFDGVRRGEELLVSYGKSYWRGRVGDLTAFVWRRPGEPMPEGGKPVRSKN